MLWCFRRHNGLYRAAMLGKNKIMIEVTSLLLPEQNMLRRLFWTVTSRYFKSGSCDECLFGILNKPQWQRQRERHQTKGLMIRTMAVHVLYISWYISLPPSAKQLREMTKFCVFWRTWTTAANFSYFCLELNAGVTYLAWANWIIATFKGYPSPVLLASSLSLLKVPIVIPTNATAERAGHTFK